jgi:integrase
VREHDAVRERTLEITFLDPGAEAYVFTFGEDTARFDVVLRHRCARISRGKVPLSVLKRFKANLRRAGVREIRFHDLRHTFGTRMAAAGVPLRTLQEWLGHRDFKTTLIYADYQPSEQEAELVQRAFGRAAGSAARQSE